jgi:hypothetical protein
MDMWHIQDRETSTLSCFDTVSEHQHAGGRIRWRLVDFRGLWDCTSRALHTTLLLSTLNPGFSLCVATLLCWTTASRIMVVREGRRPRKIENSRAMRQMTNVAGFKHDGDSLVIPAGHPCGSSLRVIPAGQMTIRCYPLDP